MYDVRHLFASIMLAGGGDLAAVSRLLGHSNTQMTADTYYELLKGEKRRAISILPSLFD
jgi:integrase